MKKVEQVKVITGKSEEDVAEKYNSWYVEMVDARESVPSLKGNPLVILDRRLTAQVTGKTKNITLAVFYEHILLQPTETGPDRGKLLGKEGFSAVRPRRPLGG